MVFDPPRALIQFLHQAEAAGMPVRFLRNVLPRYRFWVDSHGEQENSVIMIFDFMSLSRRTLRGASEFRTSSAVQTLYHEFTHAHIDLHEDGVGLRHLWPSAVRHYERQRTRGNRRVSDPERVAHEAAAAYTGWRAGKWHSAWLAMTELRAALADNVDHTRVQELLDGIASAYRADMNRRVFGYEEVNGQQQETTGAIPGQLRQYCNAVLLEQKIPNSLQSSRPLNRLYRELTRELQSRS